MKNLLIVGDLHVRGDNPRNRKGNYFQDCLMKLQEVFDIAQQHSAEIIQVGDVFNSPATSISVVADLAAFLQKQKKKLMAIPGNHDIFGHNLETLPRTPFGLLTRLGIIKDITSINDLGTDAVLHGVPFDHTLDMDLHEYKIKFADGKINILIIHGMLIPHSPGFEMRYSLLDEVALHTNANVIISGHFHQPFIKECFGTLFINPGALMRITAAVDEITRMPQVVLLDPTKVKDIGYYPEVIPLKCAKPGEEVLDRTQIEVNAQREENMIKFIELLAEQGEARFLNIQEIVENLAKADNLSESVVNEALKRIANARERSLKA